MEAQLERRVLGVQGTGAADISRLTQMICGLEFDEAKAEIVHGRGRFHHDGR